MTVLMYKPEEWKAMGNLKSSINFMKNNNVDNQYDLALDRQKKALKYFFTSVPERLN